MIGSNIVNPDDMFIIGVDSALKGLAIATLNRQDPVQLDMIKPAKPVRGEAKRPAWDRILEIREGWIEFLKNLPRKPTAVWVESAIIVNPSNSIPLAEVVSVVKLGVQDVWNMRTFEAAPSTWKKELTGYGNSGKNPIIDFLSVSDPELGERLKTYNQQDRSDLADAIGIAKYGRQSILKAIS